MCKKSIGTVWVASFDIGKKNFAFCIEEFSITDLEGIENIHRNERYHKDGTLKVPFAKIVHRVCSTGKIIMLEHFDLTENTKLEKSLDPMVLMNLTVFLDQYKEYWEQCTTFLIEQQMGFGRKQNTMALKIGQHCFSYFLFHFAMFKQVVEFPSYYKTQILGAPKKSTKHQRKMWSVEEAMRILLDREDNDTLKKITDRKKRDDVCDTITQLQAFKYLYFIDKKDL